MTLIQSWLVAVRIWLARGLVSGTEHRLVLTKPLKACEELLLKTHGLTYTSGHLTRAFQASRKVRDLSEGALDNLLEAQERRGFETLDQYVSLAMRKAYGSQ